MSYATVRMALRAPRAVIVFDGGEYWTYWARRALHLAGQVWGGSGFALVPHHAGTVHPTLLRACRAYDPDFVVTIPRTADDRLRLDPSQPIIADGRSSWADPTMASRFAAQFRDNPTDTHARSLIANACSPYRSYLPEVNWWEDMTQLDGPGDRVFVDPFQFGPASAPGPVLACPPEWGGLLGAAVAARAGVIETPQITATEPQPSDTAMNRLRLWLLQVNRAPAPTELNWSPPEHDNPDATQTNLAHRRTTALLVPVTTGHAYRQDSLVVIGDTADDFALAHLWQLTFGTGAWLPSPLGTDDPQPTILQYALESLAQQVARSDGQLLLTSLSRTDTELEVIRRRLQWHSEIPGPPAKPLALAPSAHLPWRQPAQTHLGIVDQFDNYLSVPTTQDANGTRGMAGPLPPPTLGDLGHSRRNLTWHVDIDWGPSRMVRGRGLNGDAVFTHGTDTMLTWSRSSRTGVSYQSHRLNFVPAGIQDVNKLARPAFRDLSLTDWVAAKCHPGQIYTRLSDAGRRTALLTRMLGHREAFVDLFGGDLRPALRAMLPEPNQTETTKVYPARDGVVLRSREGVLSFEGICARTPHLDRADVRDRMDAALRAGVLLRGMVLRCGICEQKQFQSVDRLGQRWACVRCGATNDLDQAAWKLPIDEPTWFYDLHPVGRQVLADNGDVPALLSKHLSAGHSSLAAFQPTYQDIEEIEFLSNDVPQAEIDLISYYEDILTVAECKSNDRLSKDANKAREEVRKKFQVAAWLPADRIIFATTAPTWNKATLTHISNGLRSFAWSAAGPPQVHLITDLASTPAESVLVTH